MNNKPIHQVKMGAVRAAVWANDTRNGTLYSVTFSRIFKQGDEWKDSQSFQRQHLPLLEKVAAAVHTWLYENRKDQEPEVNDETEE